MYRQAALLLAMSAALFAHAAPLFEMSVSIPDEFRQVNAGGELLANVRLMSIGGAGRQDAVLEYEITDSGGTTTTQSRETVAVETQANFVRTFHIPKDAASGNYVLHAKIIYADGKVADTHQSFQVAGTEEFPLWQAGLAIAAAALAVLMLTKAKPAIDCLRMRLRIRKLVKKRLSR